MRKVAFIFLGLFFLATASAYLFIPKQISITQTTFNDVSETNAAKFLIKKKSWQKWWPGKNLGDSVLFGFNGASYQLTKATNDGMEVLIHKGNTEMLSKISYLAESNLKVKISWVGDVKGDNNIIKRISHYNDSKEISQDMAVIMKRFKSFLENDRNVYGFNIHLSKVKDPIMLATSVTLSNYPDTSLINQMIKGLRQRIKYQNGKETNHPMLNIHQLNKETYQVMVGIPIDKELKTAKNTKIYRMLQGGNILEADVKGGRNSIDNAFYEVVTFAKDYRLTPPAMPFELLITDRSVVTDTSKWITKIYYPIF